jgi:large subunit ribosomal protein L4
VQAFSLADHKTKAFRQVLEKLEATRSVLLVEAAENRNLVLASRNLERVKTVPTRELNVYDLLAHKQVFLTEPAARKLSEALA